MELLAPLPQPWVLWALPRSQVQLPLDLWGWLCLTPAVQRGQDLLNCRDKGRLVPHGLGNITLQGP